MEKFIGHFQKDNISDPRVRLLGWFMERTAAQEPIVDGWKHYNQLALKGEPFLIEPSHLSDTCVPAAMNTFAKLRKLGLVTIDANVKDEEGNWKMGTKIIGTKNFLPLGVDRHPELTSEARARDRYDLDPDQLQAIAKQVTEEHLTPLVAAHRPVYDWKLPPNGGSAGIWIAHLSGIHTILPVAVDYSERLPTLQGHEEKGRFKVIKEKRRPQAYVHILEPVRLDEISEEDLRLGRAMLRSETRHAVPKQDRPRGIEVLHEIERQSDQVMQVIADALPEDVQGRWNRTPTAQHAE